MNSFLLFFQSRGCREVRGTPLSWLIAASEHVQNSCPSPRMISLLALSCQMRSRFRCALRTFRSSFSSWLLQQEEELWRTLCPEVHTQSAPCIHWGAKWALDRHSMHKHLFLAAAAAKFGSQGEPPATWKYPRLFSFPFPLAEAHHFLDCSGEKPTVLSASKFKELD